MEIENEDTGTGDIDFDAAFSEASAEPGSTPAPVVPAPVVPAVEPAPAPAPATEPVKDPAAEAAALEAASVEVPDATKPAAAPAPAPAEPIATPQIDPRFLAQALAEEQQRLAQAAKPTEPFAPAKPLTAADFLNATDNAAIEKFKTEWPDEHVAIQKLFQAEVQAHVGNALARQSQEFNAILAPLVAQANRAEVNSHEGAIHAAHPDANTIAPAVVEWIKTQPALYQPMLNQVIQQGSTQQVVDLLNQYKAAIGQTSAAPVAPASSVPSSPAPAKPSAAPALAAAALAAVPAAQRSKPAAGADPLDFDAAFEEASGLLAAS